MKCLRLIVPSKQEEEEKKKQLNNDGIIFQRIQDFHNLKF